MISSIGIVGGPRAEDECQLFGARAAGFAGVCPRAADAESRQNNARPASRRTVVGRDPIALPFEDRLFDEGVIANPFLSPHRVSKSLEFSTSIRVAPSEPLCQIITRLFAAQRSQFREVLRAPASVNPSRRGHLTNIRKLGLKTLIVTSFGRLRSGSAFYFRKEAYTMDRVAVPLAIGKSNTEVS